MVSFTVKIQQESGSIFEILSMWFMWPMIFTILIDSAGFAFVQTTLALHLQQVNKQFQRLTKS